MARAYAVHVVAQLAHCHTGHRALFACIFNCLSRGNDDDDACAYLIIVALSWQKNGAINADIVAQTPAFIASKVGSVIQSIRLVAIDVIIVC